MAHQNRFNKARRKPAGPARSTTVDRPAFEIPPRKPPTTYGKPFIILEDEQRNAFEYRSGAWVPFAMSIAQCRAEGDVKELPQKINKMTRYEVRLPLTYEA